MKKACDDSQTFSALGDPLSRFAAAPPKGGALIS